MRGMRRAGGGTGLAELHECTATELRALLAAGAATPRDIADALLRRIAAHEGLVRAWEYLDPDRVRESAGAVRLDGRPLAGIPIGVKDLFDTADMPTSYGSRLYAGHRPDRDSACVAALRGAGSVIMGKTTTTEFASVFEPAATVNPYDPSRSPGGSSSGSAAAVADRMVPIAIGTQTAGSVIRPAAYCGVLGYKPTFGTFGTAGVKLISPSLDTVGIFARSVDDLVLAAGALAAAPGGSGASMLSDPAAPRRVAPPKIAVFRTGRWNRASGAIHGAVTVAVDLLSNAGAEIGDIDIGADFEALVEASQTVFAFEVARALDPEYRASRGQLSGALVALIESGRAVSASAYQQARRLTEDARLAVGRVLDGFDAILTPATVDEAPPLADTGDPLFCRSWTLLGNPEITFPVAFGPNGLPVGLQVVGRFGGDRDLLEIARWICGRMPALPAPDVDRHMGNKGRETASAGPA